MKKGIASLLIFILVSPLYASWAFWRANSNPLTKDKKLFKESRYPEVIAHLGHGKLQDYHGQNLERAYFYLGQSYEYSNHLGRALGIYALGVKLFPNDPRLLSALALLLHRAGLEKEAQPLFEKILVLNPRSPEAHLGLAEIDARLGFLKRSQTHYAIALKAIPENADIWRHDAELLLRLRDYSQSEEAAKKSLSLDDNPKTEMDLAFIARAEGRMSLAVQYLDSPKTISFYGVKALRLKGLWLLEARKYSQAAKIAQGVLKTAPRDPIALWTKAQIALRDGNLRAARKELKKIRGARENHFVFKAAQALLKNLPPRGAAH